MHNRFCKGIVAAGLTVGLTVGLAVGLGAGPAVADIKVAATIKPIHSLVAAVMGEKGEPALLLDGPASPHVTALRPSQARIIENSDVVFAVGEGLEAFLQGVLASNSGKTIVELAEAPGIELLDFREEGHEHAHGAEDHAHGSDDHTHEAEHAHGNDDHNHGHDHDHSGVDPHIWLDPTNGKAMARHIAAVLSAADPVNASSYQANAEMVAQEIDTLESDITARLAPVKDRPFLVFHDAYQYFEERFGLSGQGAILLNPETPPGARRLQEIRHRINEAGVECVFSEPQFEIGYVRTVLEGSGARTASLDPLGVGVEPGPDAYGKVLIDLTDALADCLTEH